MKQQSDLFGLWVKLPINYHDFKDLKGHFAVSWSRYLDK